MVSRRGALKSLGLIGLGAAGSYAVVTGGVSIPEEVPFLSDSSDSLSTESKIKTVEADPSIGQRAYLKSIEFYESGAAEITLADDHACYDRLMVGHAANQLPDEAYAAYQTPEFSGPKVIDLKSVVKSNGPYPSREFEVRLFGSENEACIAFGISSITFDVPDSYMPN